MVITWCCLLVYFVNSFLTSHFSLLTPFLFFNTMNTIILATSPAAYHTKCLSSRGLVMSRQGVGGTSFICPHHRCSVCGRGSTGRWIVVVLMVGVCFWVCFDIALTLFVKTLFVKTLFVKTLLSPLLSILLSIPTFFLHTFLFSTYFSLF